MVFQNRQYDLSVDAWGMENALESSCLARNQEAEGDFMGIANQERGWRNAIRKSLSWGYPFVGFGCEDVDIREGDVSSRSACLGLGTSVGGTEWRDERCCPAGRPFNSPFCGRVNADPAGVPVSN